MRFLLAGMAAAATSFLLFAFVPGWTMLLCFISIALVGFGWLMLVFLGWRSALAATAAAVLGCGGIMVVAPELSDLSFRVLIWTNRDALAEAVRIMEPVQGTGWNWRPDPECKALAGLSPGDCATLQASLREIGAFNAWKDGQATGFSTHAWVNVRLGIVRCPGDGAEPCARPNWSHISGDWYQWRE